MFTLGLLLLMGLPGASKVRKDEPIVEKVADNLYVSKGDIEQISLKLNYWFLSMVGFGALEVYRTYRKKDDRLGKLIETVNEMKVTLEHVATREDARAIAREEVLNELQR